MSKAFHFHSRLLGSIALACSVGAVALTASPGTAHAALVPLTLVVDAGNTSLSLAPEVDPENVYVITIADHARHILTFAAGQEGDMIFSENPYPSTACPFTAPIVNPGNILTAQLNAGCSDLVRFVNVGGQGQIWIVGDTSSSADVGQLPALPAGAAPVVKFYENGEAGGVGSTNRYVVPFSGVGTLPVNLVLDSDGATATSLSVSDVILVTTPALPTYALVGLWGLLATAGIVLVQARRQKTAI